MKKKIVTLLFLLLQTLVFAEEFNHIFSIKLGDYIPDKEGKEYLRLLCGEKINFIDCDYDFRGNTLYYPIYSNEPLFLGCEIKKFGIHYSEKNHIDSMCLELNPQINTTLFLKVLAKKYNIGYVSFRKIDTNTGEPIPLDYKGKAKSFSTYVTWSADKNKVKIEISETDENYFLHIDY